MPTTSKSSTTTDPRIFGPFHPGELLREEFLEPLEMSPQDLAEALGIEPDCVVSLIAEESSLTPELALRLARYFGTSARFWINMQVFYELEVAEEAMLERIEREVTPRAS